MVVALGGPRCALALDGCAVFVNDKAAVGAEATGSEKAAVGAEATGPEKAAVGADTTGPNKAAAGSIGSAGTASATTLAEAASPVADAEKFLRSEVVGWMSSLEVVGSSLPEALDAVLAALREDTRGDGAKSR